MLLAAALEALGFCFTAVSARVLPGSDAGTPRPPTHAMPIADLDGGRWLVDIGFGARPLAPIELVDGGSGEGGPWPWTTQRPGREPVTETVPPREVPKLLVNVFDIRMDAEEAALLVTRLTELDAARNPAT